MFEAFFGMTESQFLAALLAFVRTSALLSVAPLFGNRTVPVKVKAFISLLLTVVVAPMLKSSSQFDGITLLQMVPLAVTEAFIGLLLGFTAKLIFEGFQFGGKLISHQMGLGLAEIIDPDSGNQGSPIGNIFSLLAIVLFLNLNGHHLVIAALYRSFELAPVGKEHVAVAAAREHLLRMFNEVFTIGVRLAAPGLAMMFLIEVAIGVIARLVPQMNIFFVGLPLRLGVGLFAVVASLPLFYLLFETLMGLWQRDLITMLKYL
ncbi:MAG: flagellar biosynthetic protein FliR [Calditrichaeota bacterium]|nr:MAG: flagellar biosynthetic protein FliR [Calditrichota bacterium]